MKRRLKGLVMAALCLALLCGCAAAETELRAEVGYDGTVLSGRWYPLCAQITAGEQPVDGEIQVNVYTGWSEYDTLVLPVSVPAGETQTYRLPVRPGASQRAYDVRLKDGSGALYSATARASRVVEESALLIGVLGEADGLTDALRAIEVWDVLGNREVIEAIALSAGTFPQDEREMQAFDVLVSIDRQDDKLPAAGAALLAQWRQDGSILVRRSGLSGSTETPEGTAQLVLDEIKTAQKAGEGIRRETDNYPYNEGLNSVMTVGDADDLLLPVVVLTVYVLLAGVGAYLLMKRLDRSKRLWLVIPALAVAACGALAGLGAWLEINRPMSSAVHVTHYDEDGSVSADELVLLTCAGQERTVVSTENHLPLERTAYWGFSEQHQEEMALRDICTLGESPSLALAGKADWFVRSLVVQNDAVPQGKMTASAYVEKDGLHVRVENGTDTPVRNAVLLTGVGFAEIGDLEPGDSAQLLLARTEEARYDSAGNPVIEPEQMLPFSVSLYQVAQAAVYPELAEDASFVPETEQERLCRSIRTRSLELGIFGVKKPLACMVIGETPDIRCETLLVNGEPVRRKAEKSMLIAEAAFTPVSPSGRFYYPLGMFEQMTATINEDGVPVMGRAHESAYIYGQQEALLGFDLEGVEIAGIEEIRLYAADAGRDGNDVQIDVYDGTEGRWTPLVHEACIRIDSELARRVVSPSGELFLRFSGEAMMTRSVQLPEIIVEGQQATQQEGGLDA